MSTFDEPTKGPALDVMGISLSVLCALHCILPPLLLVMVPTLALDPEAIEALRPVFIALVLPLALISLTKGRRLHHNNAPLRFAFLGCSLLIIGAFVHEPHWLEIVITVSGSVLVIASHAQNFRLCKLCPQCGPSDAACS